MEKLTTEPVVASSQPIEKPRCFVAQSQLMGEVQCIILIKGMEKERRGEEERERRRRKRKLNIKLYLILTDIENKLHTKNLGRVTGMNKVYTCSVHNKQRRKQNERREEEKVGI